MSDSGVQLKVEKWIRNNWLPSQYGQIFTSEKLKLDTGGYFCFDAVSTDKTIVANISTSNAKTASGNNGSGKIQKLRSDMLFLMMTPIKTKLMILSERDMYDLCMNEKNIGRLPNEISIVFVEIPADLRGALEISKNTASLEVTPKRKNL